MDYLMVKFDEVRKGYSNHLFARWNFFMSLSGLISILLHAVFSLVLHDLIKAG